jgi:hypothetical protein
MNASDLTHLLPKFLDFTAKLDKARGERFADTVPEFGKLMNTDFYERYGTE